MEVVFVSFDRHQFILCNEQMKFYNNTSYTVLSNRKQTYESTIFGKDGADCYNACAVCRSV